MKNLPSLALLLGLFPFTASAQGLTQYVQAITTYILGTIVPFLIGAAFLFVVFNIFRYFILEGANEEGRKKAKSYIIYSIIAFILIIVFVGIVEIISNTTGLANDDAVIPDYNSAFGG